MKVKSYNPIETSETYEKSPLQKLIELEQAKEAKAQRTASANEIIVPFYESKELINNGGEVVACFEENGIKKFKIKKPEKR